MTGLDLLKEQFNGRVAFRERRPGVVQVLAPLFHEDGDMVDIFLDEPANGSGKVRIGDHGLTLMRLIYSFDLDTENKQRIFNRMFFAPPDDLADHPSGTAGKIPNSV
jgi:hypothetical protein